MYESAAAVLVGEEEEQRQHHRRHSLTPSAQHVTTAEVLHLESQPSHAVIVEHHQPEESNGISRTFSGTTELNRTRRSQRVSLGADEFFTNATMFESRPRRRVYNVINGNPSVEPDKYIAMGLNTAQV